MYFSPVVLEHTKSDPSLLMPWRSEAEEWLKQGKPVLTSSLENNITKQGVTLSYLNTTGFLWGS